MAGAAGGGCEQLVRRDVGRQQADQQGHIMGMTCS